MKSIDIGKKVGSIDFHRLIYAIDIDQRDLSINNDLSIGFPISDFIDWSGRGLNNITTVLYKKYVCGGK